MLEVQIRTYHCILGLHSSIYRRRHVGRFGWKRSLLAVNSITQCNEILSLINTHVSIFKKVAVPLCHSRATEMSQGALQPRGVTELAAALPGTSASLNPPPNLRTIAQSSSPHLTATSRSAGKVAAMPREVSDIKQFLEICRRKDATSTSPYLTAPAQEDILTGYRSRPYKTQQRHKSNQVQSPMSTLPVYLGAQGLGEGG